MERIDERKREVLRAVVENHIEARVPVGSKTLSRDKLSQLKLSPATIRNTMAELDEMGYITQPHTSAGRLPTDKGYRFFVDELMMARKLSGNEMKRIDQMLLRETQLSDGMFETASGIISSFSQNAALVLLPRISAVVVDRFYFLKISRFRIQAVLKTSMGRVINLLLELDEDWSEAELTELSNFLNSEYAGQSLARMRQNLRRRVIREQSRIKRLRARALKVQERLLARQAGDGLIIEGISKFFDQPEFKMDAEKLRKLFQALSEKKRLIQLLDKCIDSKNIEVNIGSELENYGFEDCSLITTYCGPGNNWDGAIGVIGPRRMDYAYIFSLLEYMSGALRKICSRI